MPHSPIRSISRCALMAALLCLCGWIAIPLPGIAVTMQTFGVFLALELLGGAWGTAACFVYLLLGLAGLPVFTGFQGGIAALLGPTGGFLWGFPAAGLIYWVATALLPRQKLAAMVLGLTGCYACGTCWYVFRLSWSGAGIPFRCPADLRSTLCDPGFAQAPPGPPFEHKAPTVCTVNCSLA